MKRLRVLRRILRSTGAHRIWTGFVVAFLICAFIIWLAEPQITGYGDACWYCYAVVTTIGFGDVLAETMAARVISVLLSVYAALVIAIVTGVVVSYYNQLVQLRQKDTVAAFLDRLEHLPEMTKEELQELSEQVKSIKQKRAEQAPDGTHR